MFCVMWWYGGWSTPFMAARVDVICLVENVQRVEFLRDWRRKSSFAEHTCLLRFIYL